MGFLNTDSMPRLVEKLADGDNIKITGNSKGNRVGTVVKKIVEKADDVTKAIEQEVINDGYSFKVGTGNVDVSADVEDGFGEVGVKGVTYQNLVNGDNLTLTQNESASQYITNKDINCKPSTVYTFIVNVKSNTLSTTLRISSASDHIFDPVILVPTNAPIGIYATKVTSRATFGTNSFSLGVNSGVGSINFSLILLEGDHTNNPNLPSYFEGIVGIGDKSKNLFDSGLKLGNISWGTGVENNLQQHVMSAEYIKVRPNTKYIIHSNTSHKLNLYFYDNSKVISAPSLAGVAISFTTNSTTEYIKVLSVNNTDLSNSRFQLEEGDVATSYEPYHDGYKIEILSHGKNLFDVNNTQRYSFNATSLAINVANEDTRSFTFKIKANTTYCLSGATNIFTLTNSNCARVLFTNEFPKEGIVATRLPNLNNNVSTIRHDLSGYVTLVFLKNSGNWDYFTWFDNASSIQIEEGAIATNYEPYQEDKTQILLDEPLMRLPNGTHDEITRDGKLIRRVGKIVFDGTENWSPYNLDGNTTHFAISIPYIDKFNGGLISNIEHNSNKFMCDKALVTQTRKANLTSICSFYYGQENRYFMFNLPCSSLESAKNWLIENKPILYFPLPTPTITELPAPYLRIFKDGHLTFNTLVAPESNHVVQLNKSAQIERSIREVQSLDSRVGKLESFYDDMMLETNHKLSLLNYDFEYTRERNGE